MKKQTILSAMTCLALGMLAGLSASTVSAQSGMKVVSPDGNVAAVINIGDELSYSVTYRDAEVLAPSKLGLKFKDSLAFGKFKVAAYTTASHDETWQYPFGRQLEYRDQYNALTLTLAEMSAQNRTLDVEFRAYNDGVAFRYLIGEQTVGASEYVLEADETQFNFRGDPIAWYADFGSFHSSQEKYYPKNLLSTIGENSHVGCPIVVQTTENGPYVALAEAELNHWGGLYFGAQPRSGMQVLFDSGNMKSGNEAKPFKVSLEGAKQIMLVCDDVRDMSYDHADWVDLRLVDKNGNRTNLADLKPISVTQGWGQTQTNRSSDGNPLRIAGKEYETGFGTHANGEIVFRFDKEYAFLEGAVGVDDEVTQPATIRFFVKTVPLQDMAKLQARISPRLDGKGVAKHSAPDKSPWRLVIVAPKAINLVDQTMLMNVSAPTSDDFDWSWIKPGIGSWDWWSDSNVNMNTDTIKHFIAFASEMGWDYTFVDDPWYAGKKYRMGDPRNNVLRGSDDVDIEEVVRFAKEKNVRLFLWLNWKDIDRQMEEAFALYEKWGIAGVKIDFMDSDDQEMVEWYDKTANLAAKHKLMVDFHGSYKPTGYRRTYPNLITREGIYGNEQNKWTRISPEQYCVFPYTRLMLGPGDFTPGAFLNRHYDGPNVSGHRTAQGIGTRSHELAISLLYDSPILCLCDRPEVYRGQPGLDFYRDLPTVWDESHGVAGEIGEYFSLIRRKGNDWYYGAITNAEARTLQLPLTFLGEGRYEATIFADTPETDENAMSIAIETKTVTARDTLEIKMSREGGQVIVFKKIK